MLIWDVFAVMTTEPYELTASINHERMPGCCPLMTECDIWLSGS
jgi:putative SOS response-associated peptidase YedK